LRDLGGAFPRVEVLKRLRDVLVDQLREHGMRTVDYQNSWLERSEAGWRGVYACDSIRRAWEQACYILTSTPFPLLKVAIAPGLVAALAVGVRAERANPAAGALVEGALEAVVRAVAAPHAVGDVVALAPAEEADRGLGLVGEGGSGGGRTSRGWADGGRRW
jgi:hypothetical protein